MLIQLSVIVVIVLVTDRISYGEHIYVYSTLFSRLKPDRQQLVSGPGCVYEPPTVTKENPTANR